MIKQSFLRNYSLNRLYSQAIDQKNKLKVYYLREVRKIMHEKREKQKNSQLQKTLKENKQQRRQKRFPLTKSPFQNFTLTECCDSSSQHERLQSVKGNPRSRSAIKADLHSWQLKLNLPGQINFDQYMDNERSAIAFSSSLKTRNRNYLGEKGKQNSNMSCVLQAKTEKETERNNYATFFDLPIQKKLQNKVSTCKEKYRNFGKRLKGQITEKSQNHEVKYDQNCLRILNLAQKYRRFQTENL